MFFEKLFKRKSAQEKTNYAVSSNGVNSIENTINSLINNPNINTSDVDTFLDEFFKTDKYYFLQVIKAPTSPKEYIQIVDDKISTFIFTNKKYAKNYIETDLSTIKDYIKIAESSPSYLLEHINVLKNIDVERILFNYPFEWISFDCK